MTIKRCEYVVISTSHAQKGRNVAPTSHIYRLVGSISCLEGCRTPSQASVRVEFYPRETRIQYLCIVKLRNCKNIQKCQQTKIITDTLSFYQDYAMDAAPRTAPPAPRRAHVERSNWRVEYPVIRSGKDCARRGRDGRDPPRPPETTQTRYTTPRAHTDLRRCDRCTGEMVTPDRRDLLLSVLSAKDRSASCPHMVHSE